ncbi:MAG: extracellular solute-binding protein [Acidisphaera sp.]|nr:extracellular solute-binding protein [Acidisphaera sp.]
MLNRMLLLAAASLLAFSGMQRARAQSDVVYINSSGGVLDDVFRKVDWDPFTKATGIRVINSAPVDNAKLRAMVLSGNTEWDVTEIDGGDFPRGIKQGLLQKLDLQQLPTKDMVEGSFNDYGVWDGPYSTILTWNTDIWPLTGKHPTSLMDLWNQQDFPGPRCIRKDAIDNIEFGALHAGVPRNGVYPVDQDKAYKELDKLKPNVAVWWTTGAQSVQVLVNRDCVMGTAWNGRPYQLVVRDGAHLGVAWEDAVLHMAWWVIPKGAKHSDAALKLIAFMQDPQRQAASAKESGYAGGNSHDADYLPENVRDFLATTPAHVGVSVSANDEWWDANAVAAERRFTSWVIGQ